jgi:hypothetical protein
MNNSQTKSAMSNVLKRSRISDYSKKRALVSNDREETSNPKEIILPTMASPVACKKNRKTKSLNFVQHEKSARGLRSTFRREKSVFMGLGLGIQREGSVSWGLGLGVSKRPVRVIMEASKEEIQFDFPKRLRTKRRRKQDGDSDCGAASPRSNLKVVYDSATQKHNLVPDVMALSPIKKSRKPSAIFQRGPSFDKDESFRSASSPNSATDDIYLSPTSYSRNTMSPGDHSKLSEPAKSTHSRIVVSSGFNIEQLILNVKTFQL